MRDDSAGGRTHSWAGTFNRFGVKQQYLWAWLGSQPELAPRPLCAGKAGVFALLLAIKT